MALNLDARQRAMLPKPELALSTNVPARPVLPGMPGKAPTSLLGSPASRRTSYSAR